MDENVFIKGTSGCSTAKAIQKKQGAQPASKIMQPEYFEMFIGKSNTIGLFGDFNFTINFFLSLFSKDRKDSNQCL